MELGTAFLRRSLADKGTMGALGVSLINGQGHGSTTMPHYYFHLTDGKHLLDDPDGLELPGAAAAREEAVLVVADLKGRLRPRDWTGWFVSIRDEDGNQVDSVPVIDPKGS
jgi:hypothetical protein